MTSPAGIYIHIPFCQRKCTYCDFNTTDFNGALAARYVDALTREIAARSEQPGTEPYGKAQADTVYFGGGTPSIIEAELLASLLEACRTHFVLAPDVEVTIEINPGSFSRQKVETWLACGINRASVGIQSFNDNDLVQLSRTHSVSEVFGTLDALREAGFENVSIDLIAGLPGQTLQDWERNLEQALVLMPEHMSLYLLEVKKGTQLHSQIERQLMPEPDEDVAADMYHAICRRTKTAGYEQYEISNFALRSDAAALPYRFRSRHNMKYWTGLAYYGMGCGAHSYDGRARSINLAATESYIRGVNRLGQAVAEYHELSDAERASEALFMGLRLTEGISLNRFEDEYGITVLERYDSEIRRLSDAGLLELNGDRLRLTEAGLPLSNEVFVCFV